MMELATAEKMERIRYYLSQEPNHNHWRELIYIVMQWPEPAALPIAISYILEHSAHWPRAIRTPPERWRLAWSQGQQDPRFALTPLLTSALLPTHGGGASPVQFYMHKGKDVYYLRYRRGGFTVDLTMKDGAHCDEPLLECSLDCMRDENDWTVKETNVLLHLVGGAIRNDQVQSVILPDSPESLESNPDYCVGLYPEYVLLNCLEQHEHTWPSCHTIIAACHKGLAENLAESRKQGNQALVAFLEGVGRYSWY